MGGGILDKETISKEYRDKDKTNKKPDVKSSGDIDDFIFEDEKYKRSEK